MIKEYYYQVLPANLLHNTILTYKFNKILEKGRVVKITIKNKEYLGIVLKKIVFIPQKYELKNITQIYPIILDSKNLKFIQNLAYLTFNSFNIILNSTLKNLENILTTKFTKELENELNIENSKLKVNKKQENLNYQNKINFWFENNILFRIIYLIRSIIDDYKSKNQLSNNDKKNIVLFIFPEQKYLNKIYEDLFKNNDFLKYLKNNQDLELLIFSGKYTKESKENFKKVFLLKQNFSNSLQKTFFIIFGTKNSLFLPYGINNTNLINLTLIDEANSMYIQEYNSLYFDARDVILLLSQIYQIPLNFIGYYPSVRLLSLFKKQEMYNFDTTPLPQIVKKLNLNFSQKNFLMDNSSLFSDKIEQILLSEEEFL